MKGCRVPAAMRPLDVLPRAVIPGYGVGRRQSTDTEAQGLWDKNSPSESQVVRRQRSRCFSGNVSASLSTYFNLKYLRGLYRQCMQCTFPGPPFNTSSELAGEIGYRPVVVNEAPTGPGRVACLRCKCASSLGPRGFPGSLARFPMHQCSTGACVCGNPTGGM